MPSAKLSRAISSSIDDVDSTQTSKKKQKTSDGGKSNNATNGGKSKPATAQQTVKSVKTIDVSVIEQRRDVVQTRVLKIESKLAKDRALLAKYTAQIYSSETGDQKKKEEESSDDEATASEKEHSGDA